VGTPWDAETYDRTSKPQQRWANEVISRVIGVERDATVLDVGCGTGRVTEHLARLVPAGKVLAIDASEDMVALARERLGERAEVRHCDVLELDLDGEVDVVFSTATLHWVTDHDALWPVLARALKPGGKLEIQCGGAGNIESVREVIDEAAATVTSELDGFDPWTFASPEDTERRLDDAGFTEIKCWLAEEPAYPEETEAFVRASILGAHLQRLPEEQREPFVAAVMQRVRLPLDYVRLNVSAVRAGAA
jgi:trans-aconitate 2-methyltransferase